MSNGLSERAMLASLNISGWAARKQNKGVAARVTADAEADGDAGRWWTDLIDRKTLAKLQAASTAWRLAFYRLTLPWNDYGSRILPAAVFIDFTAEMRKHKAAFEAAAEEFIDAYPALVAAAEARLGKLYRAADFPPVSSLRERFSGGWNIVPLPDADDFRVNLGEAETAEVKRQIAAQVGETFESATADLWQRLYAAVNHIAERLSDKKNIFRDSLIENLAELVDLLPRLNVTGDPELARLTRETAERLAGRKPAELRDNQAERKDAAGAAKEIADRMAAFMGTPKG